MRALLLLALAVALSSCFQITSVLSVRPDGTATLRDELTLSGMGLMALAEEAGGDPWADLDLEARAEALGEGVRLASFEPREDGFTATYEVDDVRQLEYTPPEGMGETAEIGEVAFRFRFEEPAAGAPATLYVLVPKPDPGKPTPPADTAEAEAETSPAEQAQGLAMMRGIVGDARITVAVDVEGEVVDTTADYADGNRVTLFDLPFGPFIDFLADNPELLEGQQNASPAAFYELMNEAEGIQIEEPGTIRVRFR